MVDQQGQVIIPATAARIKIFISAVVLYSLAYYGIDVMNDINLETALEAQIQISTSLIGTIRDHE